MSLKINALVDGLIEGTSSMSDEITSKTVYKSEDGDRQRKKSKSSNEVKPVKKKQIRNLRLS